MQRKIVHRNVSRALSSHDVTVMLKIRERLNARLTEEARSWDLPGIPLEHNINEKIRQIKYGFYRNLFR